MNARRPEPRAEPRDDRELDDDGDPDDGPLDTPESWEAYRAWAERAGIPIR